MDVKIILCVLMTLMSLSAGWNSFRNPDPETDDVGFGDVRTDGKPREDDVGFEDGEDKIRDVDFDEGEGFEGFPGFNRSQARIFNGKEATKNRWNFMVLIEMKLSGSWKPWCGGVIVNPTSVVSASHCYYFGKAEDFRVVAGEHDVTKEEGTEQTVNIKEIIIHPKYRRYSILYDVAVLKLATSLTFNSAVKSYKLNKDSGCPAIGGYCSAAGWGTTTHNGKSSPVPLHVYMINQHPNICDRMYYSYRPTGQLCVGGNGRDTCKGDDGGPLLCYCGTSWSVAGITSYGSVCGSPGKPSAFARVSHFHDWITEQANK